MSFYSETLDKLLPPILTGIDSLFHKRRMRRQLYQEIAENNQKVVVHIARCTCIAGLAEGEAVPMTEAYTLRELLKRRGTLFTLRRCLQLLFVDQPSSSSSVR